MFSYDKDTAIRLFGKTYSKFSADFKLSWNKKYICI